MADNQDLQRERQLVGMAQERRDYSYEILESARQYAKVAGAQTQEIKDYLSYSRLLVGDLSEQLTLLDKIKEQTIGTAAVEKARAAAMDNLTRLQNVESALVSKSKNLQQEKAAFENKHRDAVSRGNKDEAAYYAKRISVTKDQISASNRLVETLKDQVENAKEAFELSEATLALSQDADKKTAFFTGMSNFVGSIPGLKGLSAPFENAAKAARGVALEGGKGLDIFKAGGAELFKSFGKAGLLGIVIAIGQKLLEINSQNVTFARTMNMTSTQAADLRKNLTASTKELNYMTQSLDANVKRMAEFSQEFGVVADSLSVETLQALDQLQVKFGISSTAANALAKQSLIIGENTEDVATNMLGAAEAAETQLGINLTQQQVLKDLSEVSARTSLIYGNDVVQLTNAVVQARRLGVSLQEVSSIASGLLDFESSISAELEAELLTGRELNLERARAAALTNDYATLTSEIAANIGSAADFGRMNFIQQEAIAKTVGMTADQLAKVLFEQEALTKLGYANAEERRKAFDALVQEKGMRQAIAEFGDKEYARQVSLNSVQEKFQNLLANVGTIFADAIAPEVEKLAKYLEDNEGAINNMVQGVKDFAMGLKSAGIFIDGLIVKPIQSVVNLVQGLIKMLGGIGNLLTGNIFGDGFSMLSSGAGDFYEGVANALDIGTNLAVGGGVEGEANYFTNAAQSARGSLDVDDFTIRTNPKDTLVMAGGTKFGEETNAILREIADAIKRQDRIGRVYDYFTADSVSNAMGILTGVRERGVN